MNTRKSKFNKPKQISNLFFAMIHNFLSNGSSTYCKNCQKLVQILSLPWSIITYASKLTTGYLTFSLFFNLKEGDRPTYDQVDTAEAMLKACEKTNMGCYPMR
jgi:hypothetical protein